MKIKLTLVVFATLLSGIAHASKTILPDACGADKVKFNIKQQKTDTLLLAPEDGKALIVFIETMGRTGFAGRATVRFGMDGAWVGATRGNAYFTVLVAPGEHHLCSNADLKIGLASIKAEAGKTYYFEFKLGLAYTGTGGVAVENSSPDLTLLSDDEGKYRVRAFDLAISTPKN
jgi:hypothetical protein